MSSDEQMMNDAPQPEPLEEQLDEPVQDEHPHGEITLSYAEYEELKTLAQERDEFMKRLQRAVADYQNLQKRVEKFRDMARLDVVRSLTENILPLAESLERALNAAEQTEGAETIVEGIELVQDDFYRALEKLDVRPIEALGRRFDPHYHEAVMQEPAEGMPPLSVVRELKKGFTLGDQVLRPAQVTVAPPQKPEGQ